MFPRWENRDISLGICVSQVLEHISLGICLSQVGKYIGICVSQVGEHISLRIWLSQVGEHISSPRLPKKSDGKVANLGPKPSTFRTYCFYSLERCFFALGYHKKHSPGLKCPPKKMKNGHFWTKTIDVSNVLFL